MTTPSTLIVGQHVPDWTLPDVHGQKHTLSRSLGPSGALLTFIRGMFCPYWREGNDLKQIRQLDKT